MSALLVCVYPKERRNGERFCKICMQLNKIVRCIIKITEFAITPSHLLCVRVCALCKLLVLSFEIDCVLATVNHKIEADFFSAYCSLRVSLVFPHFHPHSAISNLGFVSPMYSHACIHFIFSV